MVIKLITIHDLKQYDKKNHIDNIMFMDSVVCVSHQLLLIFLQFNTMQMMYDTIYKALQKAGLVNELELFSFADSCY